VVQERYQRAQLQDLGSKWKVFYWDYTRTPRQRRTKSWAKSRVPSQREAQKLADQFMEPVNERNNQPHLFASDEDTLQAVYNKCRELTWPHLKNSTRKQYEENFRTYLLPELGSSKVRKLTTMSLQSFFNRLSPGLSPKSIRLIHGTLRAALNQGKNWEMLVRNPAVGVKLPRKKAVKPTVLLLLGDIRRVIEAVVEPTKSMILLIVFASMRPGEVLALRWKDSFRENIDTAGPLGRAIVVIIGAIAELERSLIVERVRAGMRRARLEGQHIGRQPLVLDRAAIQQDRRQGQSIREIAKGHRVSTATIQRVLRKHAPTTQEHAA
jgi:integrase